MEGEASTVAERTSAEHRLPSPLAPHSSFADDQEKILHFAPFIHHYFNSAELLDQLKSDQNPRQYCAMPIANLSALIRADSSHGYVFFENPVFYKKDFLTLSQYYEEFASRRALVREWVGHREHLAAFMWEAKK